jgi:NADPH:quinone reductase-like Zn-dependent oxidoreductase
MPISGCYAQYVCLPQRKLIPVPAGLDSAEAVAVVLNYITAYQMLHRSAKVKPGQRVLIHGASGGVGTAFLQLGRLAGVEMYGTCSAQAQGVVKELGATPIDYRNSDFVQEICYRHRLSPGLRYGKLYLAGLAGMTRGNEPGRLSQVTL